jgi:hypothetical protein
MDRAADETETLSLDDLALRMTAYRERAAAARRLAEAVTDKGAAAGLIVHAEAFDKEAQAIAARIVLLAHLRSGCVAGDPVPETPTRRDQG